jgi:hypothetical protein
MNPIDLRKIIEDFLATATEEELLAELESEENRALAEVHTSVLPPRTQAKITATK